MSFGYLLLRTMAMALYAASIYDESRAAKDVLYAVPSHNYQVEVRQFHFSHSERRSPKIELCSKCC
jgi:hypothetical protein